MKKSLPPLVLAVFVLAAVVGCSHYPTEQLHARAWKTVDARGVALSTPYPETTLGALRDRANVGIAFSGGGNRAATQTLGQLRALDALGLLRRVKYISAVSGGTWCMVPYTFLPEASRQRDALFLGPLRAPEQLVWGM